jgi:hypothetical protein
MQAQKTLIVLFIVFPYLEAVMAHSTASIVKVSDLGEGPRARL